MVHHCIHHLTLARLLLVDGGTYCDGCSVLGFTVVVASKQWTISHNMTILTALLGFFFYGRCSDMLLWLHLHLNTRQCRPAFVPQQRMGPMSNIIGCLPAIRLFATYSSITGLSTLRKPTITALLHCEASSLDATFRAELATIKKMFGNRFMCPFLTSQHHFIQTNQVAFVTREKNSVAPPSIMSKT